MVDYNIMHKKDKTYYYGVCPCGCGAVIEEPREFQSLDEAKTFINNDETLIEFIPKIVIDDSWKQREIDRFSTGNYNQPVWYKEKWYKNSQPYLSVYPHIALATPMMIAYTETPEKGMLDVQTRTTPGRFLKKFFSNVLTQDEIEKWSSKHREAWSQDLNLRWATTPEEFAEVYSMDAGFTSCMQHHVTKFSSPIHPTSVYAAGDLRLGYITQGATKLLARALVWDQRDKLKYTEDGSKVLENIIPLHGDHKEVRVGRIYGDVARMRKALADNGIVTESNNSSYDTMGGARLLKLKHQGQFVAPYIDGNARVVIKPDYLEIENDANGKYNFVASETGGLAGNARECDYCHRVRGGLTRIHLDYNEETAQHNTNNYCPDCLAEHTFRDDLAGGYFHRLYHTPITVEWARVDPYSDDSKFRTGQYHNIAKEYNLRRGFIVETSAPESKFFRAGEVRYLGMADGETKIYSNYYVSRNLFRDSKDNLWYPNHEKVKIGDQVFSKKNADTYFYKVKGKWIPKVHNKSKHDLFPERFTGYGGEIVDTFRTDKLRPRYQSLPAGRIQVQGGGLGSVNNPQLVNTVNTGGQGYNPQLATGYTQANEYVEQIRQMAEAVVVLNRVPPEVVPSRAWELTYNVDGEEDIDPTA